MNKLINRFKRLQRYNFSLDYKIVTAPFLWIFRAEAQKSLSQT